MSSNNAIQLTNLPSFKDGDGGGRDTTDVVQFVIDIADNGFVLHILRIEEDSVEVYNDIDQVIESIKRNF